MYCSLHTIYDIEMILQGHTLEEVGAGGPAHIYFLCVVVIVARVIANHEAADLRLSDRGTGPGQAHRVWTDLAELQVGGRRNS